MAFAPPQPLSNLQLELLKVFSSQVTDEDLFQIRLMLGRYFARKATEAMDLVWQEKGLTEQDMIDWTYEHHRYSGSH